MTREHAVAIASSLLSGMGDRWRHARTVGSLADVLGVSSPELCSPVVVQAAWLHDIGYAEPLRRTGLHALDGAAHLRNLEYDERVVTLVAHHTGACVEAVHRGMPDALDAFPHPATAELDLLTLLDMSVGPTGDLVHPVERVEEILHRYAPRHPVHGAVDTGRTQLLDATERARRGLRLADDWPFGVQAVVDALTHARVDAQPAQV